LTRHTRSHQLSTCILIAAICLLSAHGLAAQAGPQEPERDRLVAIAREVMAAADLCALVTLDASGQPQVRTMDPFAPDDDMVVWFGTFRKSRKVAQIRNDPRVALHYLAPEGVGYVSIEGTARIVDDPAETAQRWKDEWEAFYPDRDADYVLIAVTPKTLRVLETTQGVMADEKTWVVPSVDFTAGDPDATSHVDDHDSHAAHVDTNSHEDHLAADTHEQGIAGLEQNQGSRWEMDDHTRSMFAQMETTFSDADLDALEGDGLKNAGSALQEEIDLLIEGCTMTGDAHEQLHMYLAGFIPAVAALSESGQVEDGEKVQHYLEQYPKYFE